MYADRDSNGHFSIMDITREELILLRRILHEFEFLIQNYCGDNPVGDKETINMLMLSASIRFKIVDALKL